MGKVHKINDEYYIEFYARGLLYQQKAGNDLGKAEELLRQTEEKIARGELQTVTRDIDLDVFFVEYLKYAPSQFHPHTVRRLKSTIDHFQKFLTSHCSDVKKLSQVTPRVIEDYKTFLSENLSNQKRINLTLLLLREILEHGIKTGQINDNPTLHVRLLDIKPGLKVLSQEQLEALLQKTAEPYRLALLFMRHTGLRPTEVMDLTWQQVDFNRNAMFIRSREVPLTSTARTILKDLFERVIDHKARIFLNSEGLLQHVDSLNVFRHAFACDLLHKRVSFLLIGKILGVHDISKLMIYASCVPTQRKDMLP